MTAETEQLYYRVRNFLMDSGYAVNKAIHIGDNKFEFKEHWTKDGQMGCHDIHKILGWIDPESDTVVFQKKVVGFCCND